MAFTEIEKIEIAKFINIELKNLYKSQKENSTRDIIASTHLANKTLEKHSGLVNPKENIKSPPGNQFPSMTFTEHQSLIKERQKSIPGINLDNGDVSAHYGNNPSRGCTACKQNRWVTIFIGKACNLKCSFCPQAPKPLYGDERDTNGMISTSFGRESYTELIKKLELSIQAKKIDAIGYSGGEPLMYVDRIVDYADKIRNINSNIYQYIYTNGVLVDEQKLLRLREAGITEIRFDLAATNFSKKVIKKMEVAKEIFKIISVEVPALPGIALKIKKNIKNLLSIGIHQINLCEVVINEFNWEFFKNEPFYIVNPYQDKIHEKDHGQNFDIRQYERIVPVKSRFETYNLIELAQKGKWPIVINDCSQGVHYKAFVPY
jgi:pyruvate-formate lyase-activating enzyme